MDAIMNIYCTVKVKLSETGLNILKEREVKTKEIFEVDDEGYYHFVYWQYMNIFGSHLCPNQLKSPFFEDELIICNVEVIEHSKQR